MEIQIPWLHPMFSKMETLGMEVQQLELSKPSQCSDTGSVRTIGLESKG